VAGIAVGRLVSTADFDRVLGTKPWARSLHFSIHHLALFPVRGETFSTGEAPSLSDAVDDLSSPRHWLGPVVPKRHARRAVTRNLLKRQIRAAVERHALALPPGMWVVRLRAPFDRTQFLSAASRALRDAARGELDAMLACAER
jgi:ribonuclease P protein component